MKPEELMLGDIVLASGKPIHVTFATLSCKVDVKPMPLTPEILEKNGFVPIRQNAGEPYYWQYFDKRDGSIVNAFRRIYRGLWIECSNATTEASTNKQCEFVHELQHALKLCGIEKEVVV